VASKFQLFDWFIAFQLWSKGFKLQRFFNESFKSFCFVTSFIGHPQCCILPKNQDQRLKHEDKRTPRQSCFEFKTRWSSDKFNFQGFIF